MKQVHARVIIPVLDGSTDPASNSLYFENDTASDFSGLAPLTTALTAFYNTTTGSMVESVASYMSSEVSPAANAAEIEYYDITSHLNGSPAGSPVAIANFTMTPSAGSSNFPAGVAATLSYRADYGTDVEFLPGSRPRSRDRNRIYIGPLSAGCTTPDAITKRPHFTVQFMNDLLLAFTNLSGTHGGWNMRVWTRKGAALKLPTQAYMDNRPDYQRRRSDPTPGTKVTSVLLSV